MNKQFFIIHWSKGKQWNESAELHEQADIANHLAFLNKLYEQGYTVISGVTTEAVGGIGVLQFSSKEEAQNMIAQDPCIQNEVMTFDIIPFNPINWKQGINEGVNFINQAQKIEVL
jgi:uncharacterized protein YciI